MRTGRYVYEQTDLSIGGENGGLALTRTTVQQVAGHTNPFANFSHNWDILLTEKRVNILENNFVHNPGQPDYQIEIAFGARSQSFRGYGRLTGFELVSRSGYGMLSYTGNRSSAERRLHLHGRGRHRGDLPAVRHRRLLDRAALRLCLADHRGGRHPTHVRI